MKTKPLALLTLTLLPALFTPAFAADLPLATFASTTQFSVGGTEIPTSNPIMFRISLPQSVNVGDFNGDGNADIITMNDFNELSVLLGDGHTGFSTQIMSTVIYGSSSNGLGISDFNSDGKTDLAIPDGTDGVNVFLSDGSGSFGTKTNFVVNNPPKFKTWNVPHFVVVNDFNSDGKSDLVMSVSDEIGKSGVAVLLGDSKGNFSPPITTNRALYMHNEAIVAGDFNADKIIDLAIADNYKASISILLGDGSGHFGTETTFEIGNEANVLHIADFNSDGNVDIVVGSNTAHKISILLGNEKGDFTVQDLFTVGEWMSIRTGDFNADGKIDIVSSSTDGISLLLGNGKGSFISQNLTAKGNGSEVINVSDVDNDGKTDIVVANGYEHNVSVLINTTATEQTRAVDLSVTITKPAAVTVNKKATYKLTVTNNSEFTATGVKAYFVIPGKTLVTVDVPKNCTANGRIVECTLADLAAKKNATQSFSMRVWKKGALNVAATTTSVEDDVNLDNNEASAVISVK